MSIKYEKENGHDVIVVMRDTKPFTKVNRFIL
jgi:hypothetical protein